MSRIKLLIWCFSLLLSTLVGALVDKSTVKHDTTKEWSHLLLENDSHKFPWRYSSNVTDRPELNTVNFDGILHLSQTSTKQNSLQDAVSSKRND